MNEKISIIIPIYNSEKYLRRCISSVIQQSYADIEIILVDDGSTDNSKNICEEFYNKDNRIKVIYKDNEGSSSARNKGIEIATGKYIIFVDSDDWIEKNTIEELNNIMYKNKPELLIYGITTKQNIEKGKKIKEYLIREEIFLKGLTKLILNERINSPCNKVYLAEIIKDNNIKFKKGITIAEDLLFNINYSKYINSIYMINKEYYHYTIEENDTLSKRYNKNKYNELMTVNNDIYDILASRNDKKILRAINFIKIKNIFSCIIDLSHRKCVLINKEKIKFIRKIKKENKINIIYDIGIKPLAFSIIYNMLPSEVLLVLSKKIRRSY